ncbi:MAG: efflux transporter outer membrane subunit [Desulfobacterales bacterium]|nr:efflux transporter outer membrane subunit [Desulfobacterales bacterium]
MKKPIAPSFPVEPSAAGRRSRCACGLLAVFAAAACLSACAAVGPDYVRPQDDPPTVWHTDLQKGLSEAPADPLTLSRWWATLNDPDLSRLVERAALGNLDLAEARARVREARARRGISTAALFPVLDASGAATRSRSSENRGSGETGNFYTAGFDAGWELDVFGGVRRSIEAAEMDLQASQEELHDVMVSLLAEVALNYVEARTFQARLGVAEANVVAQEETFGLIRSRYEAGLSSELAFQESLFNLESTRSQIPRLRTGLEAAKNRLAVLLGEQPGAVHAELAERRPIPLTPLRMAVGVPADALRRRPDVRRAERSLAAQTARIGVATADLYPKFSLAGGIGLESLAAGDFLEYASRTWNLGPSFSWNVFDAGAIRRNIEVQSALQEQALMRYESALLIALEEVENALVAYAEEQFRRESLTLATDAAGKAVQLAQEQYKAGLVDFSNVLIAQRSLLTLQDELAITEGAVTGNLVRLYKALGGGWRSMTGEDGGGGVWKPNAS